MRTISRTSRFKRDYKREMKGVHGSSLPNDLTAAVFLLATNAVLPQSLRDHPLAGEWKGFRDCHFKADLVMIYRLPDDQTLELVRLGSHSELGF
jgi:mRNA interferase YafQ